MNSGGRRKFIKSLGVGIGLLSGCTTIESKEYGSISYESSEKIKIGDYNWRSLEFRLGDKYSYPRQLAGVQSVIRPGEHSSMSDSYNALTCLKNVRPGLKNLLEEKVPKGSEQKVLYDEIDTSIFYIWLDSVSLNEILLKEGYAFIPEDHSFSVRDEFEQVLTQAKKDNLGVWDCRDEVGGSRFDYSGGDNSGGYSGDYDCDDFSSQAQAQEVHDESGGAHGLDGDGDGIACEELR